MMSIDINETIADAERLKRELESDSPAEKTREWFAINNLNAFIDHLRGRENDQDVKNAASVLSRFAVDSLEWGSDLMKRIEEISDNARRAAGRVD